MVETDGYKTHLILPLLKVNPVIPKQATYSPANLPVPKSN